MWRWVVLFLPSLVLVRCAVDLRLLSDRRYHDKSQVSCVDYPDSKVYDGGWPHHRNTRNVLGASTQRYHNGLLSGAHAPFRRLDRYFPRNTDLVKEHAKLVQDINSLRHVVYVAPFAEESRDYDDSIIPEFIETYTTTTARPTTSKSPRPTRGIPIILLGSASQRQLVQPIKYQKQVISLVGTSVSPLTKHPYPFVMQASSRQPVKICVTAPPLIHTTTRRPSLWERLVNSIIPRSLLGSSRPNLVPV